jgi:hypothetical protein
MAHPLSLQSFRRGLAALLSALIAFGPLLTPAYAAGLIPLANEPIGIQNNAPPNIVLTIDDSSSMLSDWLPEAVARDDFDINFFCRDGVGAMTSACGSPGGSSEFFILGGPTDQYYSPGYTAQQFGYPFPLTSGNNSRGPGIPYDASGPGAGCVAGAPPTCYHGVDPVNLPGGVTQPNGIGNFPINDPNDATSPPAGWAQGAQPYPYWQLWPAPVHNAAVNALYYNPELTYDPPVDSTGASYHDDVVDAGARRSLGDDRRQHRPHGPGHRRRMVQLRLVDGRGAGNQWPTHDRFHAVPPQRHRRGRGGPGRWCDRWPGLLLPVGSAGVYRERLDRR